MTTVADNHDNHDNCSLPNTARAVDAAVHDSFDERSNVLVFHSPLAVARVKARPVRPKGHGLVLSHHSQVHLQSPEPVSRGGRQTRFPEAVAGWSWWELDARFACTHLKVAFSALVADGAVQWMVYQQKLHHTLPAAIVA